MKAKNNDQLEIDFGGNIIDMQFIYKKKMAIVLALAIFFVASDRFLKSAAMSFADRELSIAGDFFKFSLEKNYYIAFSIPFSGSILIPAIGFMVLFLIIVFFVLYKRGEYIGSLFLLSLILGAVSNLYDRLKFGYVIDYFDLKYFTVFNLADAMIVSGIIGFLILEIRSKKTNKYIFYAR